MSLQTLERPASSPAAHLENVLHECAACRHKERVYLTAPNGTQTAAVWRCRTLSQKTQNEVLVQPHENCYQHRSLTDYWEPTQRELVR
ncbi:MAG: hypothetical protein JO250_05115 [Armatimonadetes bacterium]|nr:hypothetical protein [Armatimonadota bacterium]